MSLSRNFFNQLAQDIGLRQPRNLVAQKLKLVRCPVRFGEAVEIGLEVVPQLLL